MLTFSHFTTRPLETFVSLLRMGPPKIIQKDVKDYKVGNGGGGGDESEEECHPSLRLCHVNRPLKGSCGFHLSRTQWDPYPWVSGVEQGSAAEAAGLVIGDCVLEVNGEDVLGQRIGEVAVKVKSKEGFVKLLIWNAGAGGGHNGLSTSGPTPLSLQRLAVCVQSIIQLLECPVCMENIIPPVQQCYNGHLICSTCRSRSEKCPICRVNLGNKGRCLLADKLHQLLTNTFKKSSKPIKIKMNNTNSTTTLSNCLNPALQLKSRLKCTSLETLLLKNDNTIIEHVDSDDSTDSSNETITETLNNNEVSYYCPYGKSCGNMYFESELTSHIKHGHSGPVVQFHSKTGKVKIHLPILDLVCINCFGLTFFLHITKHVTYGHNTMWLWLKDDVEKASEFKFKFSINSFVLNGNVFPLNMNYNDILCSKSQQCVKLSDEILDNNSYCQIEIFK